MAPKWFDDDASESHLTIIYLASYFADNYTKLCTIEADLSRASILVLPTVAGKGKFYQVDYDLILLSRMTELQAQLAWTENVSRLHVLFKFNRYRINFSRGFQGVEKR